MRKSYKKRQKIGFLTFVAVLQKFLAYKLCYRYRYRYRYLLRFFDGFEMASNVRLYDYHIKFFGLINTFY
jgi:hypothetical protein